MATTQAKSHRQGTFEETTILVQGSRDDSDANQCHAFPTELGAIALSWRGRSVTRISIGHGSEVAALSALSLQDAEPTSSPPEFIQDLICRLQDYAAGKVVTFGDVTVDLSHLSPFQKKVVDRCRRIVAGKTQTYGQLAALAGYPGAARAVGSVMSRNRYPIIIPCHRVVGSAGSLGGFSAPQGISLKERMLVLEGGVKRPPLQAKDRKRKAK